MKNKLAKLKNCNDDVDSFNQNYLNLDSSCKIESLDKNTVYTFGDSVHNFVNDSNKLRVNFVFELILNFIESIVI